MCGQWRTHSGAWGRKAGKPGPFTPVSLGDYCAGSNHVLPTAGCACHSSGLNVKSFLKAVNVISYDRSALSEVARHVEVFAESEDLPAHGAAVTRRFPGDSPSRRFASDAR